MGLQRIIVTNAKGGCGKTTIATNLASHYALHGKDVRLFDHDTQGSSLAWLNRRSDDLTSIGGVDNFNYNDILVIVKPPSYAPSVINTVTGSLDTFMQERFICFSYRYKYKNNEYSATSQFTNPSFVPQPFSLSSDNFLMRVWSTQRMGPLLHITQGVVRLLR